MAMPRAGHQIELTQTGSIPGSPQARPVAEPYIFIMIGSTR